MKTNSKREEKVSSLKKEMNNIRDALQEAEKRLRSHPVGTVTKEELNQYLIDLKRIKRELLNMLD